MRAMVKTGSLRSLGVIDTYQGFFLGCHLPYTDLCSLQSVATTRASTSASLSEKADRRRRRRSIMTRAQAIYTIPPGIVELYMSYS
jgi:hypothetical protein